MYSNTSTHVCKTRRTEIQTVVAFSRTRMNFDMVTCTGTYLSPFVLVCVCMCVYM